MCGVAGFWGEPGPSELLERTALRMADQLQSRGPDAAGAWCAADSGFAVGHRRLSIVDLSTAGAQPMSSADGRWAISYNGEIYNAGELAKDLERGGARFRGHSDTEVLVEAIATWGIEATLPRLNGMFAFAAWDRRSRTLSLARDRLGIKPLYYGWSKRCFLFGSELKALEAHPDFEGEIDADAITLLLRHCYIPSPHSVYQRVRKLPPGHWLVLRGPREPAEPACWWNAREKALDSARHPLAVSPHEAVDAIEALARDAVRIRMVADVPLGAFLSGGIDSSTVVALMQSQSDRPVRTFTIGFHEDEFNEAHHARRIAEQLGTDHTELYVSFDEARSVIPDLPRYWDEPFADASQIPTFLVSQLARQSVTVSLSGDGGDELFGGYGRYEASMQAWRPMSRWPSGLRTAAAACARHVPGWAIDTAGRVVLPLLRRRPRGRLRDSVRYRGERLAQPSIDELYRLAVSYWSRPEQIVLGATEPETPIGDRSLAGELPNPIERMMLVDSVTYLPDDILTKVDRASMAVSLEARVPLLDHRMYELAWRLPFDQRVRKGVTKWPLREILARHVPRGLFERPKQGFGVPIGVWLAGPLREWAEDLLAEARLRREGTFRPDPIRQAWTAFLQGRGGEQLLWIVLMFQAWRAERRGF